LAWSSPVFAGLGGKVTGLRWRGKGGAFHAGEELGVAEQA
jgi:hypothetical protein